MSRGLVKEDEEAVGWPWRVFSALPAGLLPAPAPAALPPLPEPEAGVFAPPWAWLWAGLLGTRAGGKLGAEPAAL